MMSDLIEQLRFCAESESENYPFLPVSDNIMALAVDRIQELEKENDELKEWRSRAFEASPNIDIDIDYLTKGDR
jgi:hypothetical protein